MNINIKTTNITLSPALSKYTEKRFSKIDKILGKKDSSIKCDVELGKTTDHHQKGEIFRAEIHIVGKGLNVYASSERSDIFSAIDEVKDETLQEILKGRGKRASLIKRSRLKVKNMLKGLWPWKKDINNIEDISEDVHS